jgi:hypothetical protein
MMPAMRVRPAVVLLALSAAVGSPIAQTTLPVLAVAGERFKVVLKGDGTMVGWGNFSDGQLATQGGVEKASEWISRQVTIALPRKAVGIAAGENTSYAVLDDGTVMAWGRGENGQLGNGPAGTTGKLPNGMTGSFAPVRVSGLGDIIQIAAAGDSALALRKDGTVWAWGGRGAGVIGDGLHPKRYGESGPPALVPVRVPGVSGITQISTSGVHAMALTSDGRVLTWGTNTHGALGREPRRELPIDEAGEVPGLTDVVVALAGQGVSTALKKDGTVWVWGANWHGQFGNGERTDPPGMDHGWELSPRPVPGIANVVGIAVGLTGRHTLVVLRDGTLRGWGNTDWGQIGAGVSGQFQPTPVTPRISGVAAVFAAGNNSFAVKTDGSLWMWGGGGPREWPLTVNTKTPVPWALK